MSASMSSPWIRDYIVDVAETYGAQCYNAPAMTKGRKKVQLIDFLTYHENSYVWAWISDKNFRVSARISKDAVDEYKSKHGRSIVDSRHYLIFISNFRPMFSPRPLGSKSPGNTPISHMSLEIGSVSFMGIGAHMFGTPRDLESDPKMKEWILGLRQDGGGGNVLKLRKQQDPGQNKKTPSPPPPPFSSYAPASQYQTTATPEVSAKSKGERPQSFQRLYAKRWRKVDCDRWKFAAKPEEKEQPRQAESSHPLSDEPSVSPPRTPLHAPSQRQCTPTDWSPSNRGSPIVSDETSVTGHPNRIEQHDEPGILATSQILSGAEEHIEETATASDSRSLQPPTPAQRIKPFIFSSSPRTGNSLEKFPSASPRPVQQLPSSSPLLLDSSLPLPSSSLPEQMGVRRTIQRKVPHPGLSLPRPDRTKQGPIQILVPNSDASQQNQPQLLSRLPGFPSSLAQEFKPVDSSTPREGESGNSKIRDTSKMISQPVSIRGDIDDQGNPAG
ncbi:hypothetical protein JVU11DRAFT_2634 [Chiua virens]|nr:hypothetical protein JVU11DRAFT_2634 [Chiua virens]